MQINVMSAYTIQLSTTESNITIQSNNPITIELSTNAGIVNETDPIWNSEKHNYYTKSEIENIVTTKQDILISGTNIKTINNQSILGSGDLSIQGVKTVPILDYQSSTNKEVLGITNLSFFGPLYPVGKISEYTDLPEEFISYIQDYLIDSSSYLFIDNDEYYFIHTRRIVIYKNNTLSIILFPFFDNYKLYIFKYNNYIYFCNSHLNIVRYHPQTDTFEVFFSAIYNITEAPNFLDGYLVNCYGTYILVSYFDDKFTPIINIVSTYYDEENDRTHIFCDTSTFSIGDVVWLFGVWEQIWEVQIEQVDTEKVIVVGNFHNNIDRLCKYNPIDFSSDLLQWELPQEIVDAGLNAEGMVIYRLNDKNYTVLGGYNSAKFLYEITSVSNNGIEFQLVRYLGLLNRRAFYCNYQITNRPVNYILVYTENNLLFLDIVNFLSIYIPLTYVDIYNNSFILNTLLYINDANAIYLPNVNIIYKEQ